MSTNVIFVDCWTDFTAVIEVNGRDYYFEWSDRFGPRAVNKDGSERKREWTKTVWDCVQAWCDQGKRLDGDRCVYDPPERRTVTCAKCGRKDKAYWSVNMEWWCKRCYQQEDQ
jgi:hypothetical protein